MKVRKNKYLYLFVLQGNYGYGWDDLSFHNDKYSALKEKVEYNINENYPHRIIKRRVLNK